MDQYAKSFTKPSIRIGTITVILAMVGSFFPNIYLYLAYGIWPDASHMFSAWGSIAMAFGAFYLVEPISYFPAERYFTEKAPVTKKPRKGWRRLKYAAVFALGVLLDLFLDIDNPYNTKR